MEFLAEPSRMCIGWRECLDLGWGVKYEVERNWGERWCRQDQVFKPS